MPPTIGRPKMLNVAICVLLILDVECNGARDAPYLWMIVRRAIPGRNAQPRLYKVLYQWSTTQRRVDLLALGACVAPEIYFPGNTNSPIVLRLPSPNHMLPSGP